jgi:hypothetical protein
MIPLVPHGRENWPVAVSFFFSGRAQQLDCCRVSHDSRNKMVARLLGDLPRLFYFLVVANVQVLHHILAMGRLPIEPSFPKVKRFRWVTKSRSTRTYIQQSAGNRRSIRRKDGMVCAGRLMRLECDFLMAGRNCFGMSVYLAERNGESKVFLVLISTSSAR